MLLIQKIKILKNYAEYLKAQHSFIKEKQT